MKAYALAFVLFDSSTLFMFVVVPDYFRTNRFHEKIVQYCNRDQIRVPYIYDVDGPFQTLINVYVLELYMNILDKPNSIVQYPVLVVIYDSKQTQNKINNAFIENEHDLFKIVRILKKIASEND